MPGLMPDGAAHSAGRLRSRASAPPTRPAYGLVQVRVVWELCQRSIRASTAISTRLAATPDQGQREDAAPQLVHQQPGLGYSGRVAQPAGGPGEHLADHRAHQGQTQATGRAEENK